MLAIDFFEARKTARADSVVPGKRTAETDRKDAEDAGIVPRAEAPVIPLSIPLGVWEYAGNSPPDGIQATRTNEGAYQVGTKAPRQRPTPQPYGILRLVQ